MAAIAYGNVKPKLSRALLRKQKDWMDWATSEYKMLNDYKEQDMFGPPQRAPPNSNILPMICIYLIKMDGTK